MYFNIFQRFVALDLDSFQHEIPVLLCLFCRCRTYFIVMVMVALWYVTARVLSSMVPHHQIFGEHACHPERSEGSGSPGAEILRCAQQDRAGPCCSCSVQWRCV